MKLMYQQVLAFLTVTITALAIVGVLFTQFTTKMVEDNAYSQLNRFAVAIAEETMRFEEASGNFAYFDTSNLKTESTLLKVQGISFTLYGADQRTIYPTKERINTVKITNDEWQSLKNHKIIQKQSADERGARTLDVIKPFFDKKDRLVAVVVAREATSSVSDNLVMLRKNLFVAFLISTIAVIMLSFIFSRLIVNRLRLIQIVTRRVSDGDYSARAHLKGRDEVVALADDVNSMTSSLQSQADEIEEQEERRKEFMANASHEMRTPLTTISGIVEGLQYDVIPEDDKQHSYDLIKAEADRLARLVKDNLDYERLRQNKVVLKKEQFDAVQLLQRLMEQLRRKANLAGDKLIFEGEMEVLTYADRDRFTQIIFNIINNAIQFTENGEITVKAQRENGQAVFTITDTGIGMSEDQVSKIWERYYKADESRTKRGETGLGMAIIRQLVEVHEGTITVKSVLGKGTTFTVTIPDKK
ncbi:sensor histidine kinase [Weissella oryzae]|nr:HAMP domain-containing sensor histidine kinase [Weissella oryzae]